MFIVYVLQSETTGRYYIGMTSDLEKRVRYHNHNANLSTRNRGPWRVVYSEMLKDKQSALFREKQIKRYKGGEAFKKLLRGEVA